MCPLRLYNASISIPHTNCCELAPYVYDHDDGHEQSNDMRESSRALENDGVGQLNRTRVASRLCEVCQRER